MKYLLITLLSIAINVSAQEINKDYILEHYNKQDVQITMRDGVKLYTVVYSPNDNSEKHPIMMVRTPYTVDGYDKDISKRLYTYHWKNYIKEGYIFVIQDVRGCFMSEGKYMDLRPFIKDKKSKTEIDESTDTYDTVDWLIKNVTNNNGNVGVMGVSYPGFYSTMAALSGHPAIKAVSPQAPVTDWFIGDDFHHNGAFMLQDAFNFYTQFGVPHPKPRKKWASEFDYKTNDMYSFYLKTGALQNFTKLTGDSIQFWNDLMMHPNLDDWWKARNARNACYNIKSAMLVVGGYFDAEDCYGAWNLYKAIEKQSPTTKNNLVMGPWFHGQWSKDNGAYLGDVRFGSNTSAYYQQEIELPFFNYYLKGKGSIEKLAEATIFMSGENQWRKFSSWPPANTSPTAFYLNDKHSITTNLVDLKGNMDSYISDTEKPVPYIEGFIGERTREYMTDDQRFAAKRPDVLVYETSVLMEDMTVTGTILADLKVTLNTTDADFIVKVIDVFPDDFIYDSTMVGNKKETEMGGYQMLVRGEVMRGRFRMSFEKPEAFTPGALETVAFELPDVAHTFKKGHKLMIQIQSSWFPLVDRNPQTFTDIYHCSDNDFVKSTISIYHTQEYASKIVLPILK
jgi:uncharacterized protein